MVARTNRAVDGDAGNGETAGDFLLAVIADRDSRGSYFW